MGSTGAILALGIGAVSFLGGVFMISYPSMNNAKDLVALHSCSSNSPAGFTNTPKTLSRFAGSFEILGSNFFLFLSIVSDHLINLIVIVSMCIVSGVYQLIHPRLGGLQYGDFMHRHLDESPTEYGRYHQMFHWFAGGGLLGLGILWVVIGWVIFE